MAIDREMLDLLGVTAGCLERAGSFPAPADTTGSAASIADLAVLLLAAEVWAPVGEYEVPVSRSGALIAVPCAARPEVLLGTQIAGGELLGYDTRASRVLLRIAADDGTTWVIDARDGRVDRFVLDALADLPPMDPPIALVEAPDVEVWASRVQAQPWLAVAAAAAAGLPSTLDRIAGAGLLARLWTEPDGAQVDSPPRELARAWARSLDADLLDAAEGAAVRRAWRLADRLAEVGSLLPDVASAEMSAIILDRDDLQSIRRVLRLAGRGVRLDDALATTDRAADEHLSALADLLPSLDDDPNGDRWRAVAWQEPDAWWTGA